MTAGYSALRGWDVLIPSIAITGGLIWVVAATILIASMVAMTKDNLKARLAYSTISQLGFMIMGLAAGSYFSGMFHLTTHAFFKALLFLAAGSVIHGVHTNNMRDMGGLRKPMPYTFWTFLIGSLALALLVFVLVAWMTGEAAAGMPAQGHGNPSGGPDYF
mgnify:CR=1 FL=1